MTDHMGEARKLSMRVAIHPMASMEKTIEIYAAAISEAYERGKTEERERCAKLCEDTAMTTPYGQSKRTHSIYAAHPSTHVDDNSHHVGLGYAALIRGAKP